MIRPGSIKMKIGSCLKKPTEDLRILQNRSEQVKELLSVKLDDNVKDNFVRTAFPMAIQCLEVPHY